MDGDEILKLFRSFAVEAITDGRIELSEHAEEVMRKRGIAKEADGLKNERTTQKPERASK